MSPVCERRGPVRLVLVVLVLLAGVGLGGCSSSQAFNSQYNQDNLADSKDAVQTKYGPLEPSDVDLLNRVRQAGLWEMPAGEMARTRGSAGRVQEIGMTLMVDHGRLDVATRALAAELGVQLPDRPNDDQQRWLAEMQNARSPAEFDAIFANRLRAAHGVIFSVISQVRAGTRNDKIRDFATVGNQAVLRHITLLESTGLVDHSQLPLAASMYTPKRDIDATDVLIAVGLVIVAIIAMVLLLGMRRNRKAKAPPAEPKKPRLPPEPERPVRPRPLFAKRT